MLVVFLAGGGGKENQILKKIMAHVFLCCVTKAKWVTLEYNTHVWIICFIYNIMWQLCIDTLHPTNGFYRII